MSHRTRWGVGCWALVCLVFGFEEVGSRPGFQGFSGGLTEPFGVGWCSGLAMLTEAVSCRFGEAYSRLPLASSVDLRLRTLKLPYSKYSLGANVLPVVFVIIDDNVM